MWRALLTAVLLCASAAVAACPLCLGAGQPTSARRLVEAGQAVLAVPTAAPDRFRVVAVVKGPRPATPTIEGGFPPAATVAGAQPRRDRPLLLVRDDPMPVWTILGDVGIDQTDWLRGFAAGSAAATGSDGRAGRVDGLVRKLENRERLVAELAHGELAAAAYADLRTAKPRLDAVLLRRWLSDPDLVARWRLYTLLLGIAGDARDAAELERRLGAMSRAADATLLGPLLAADLELRGAARLDWIEATYLRDRSRSSPEVQAALMALSVHGHANAAVPRARIIEAYRAFMRQRPEIAGYVAPDLAAWQVWDATPDYLALLRSDVPQQFASRLAILAYLGQSPSAGELARLTQGDAEQQRRGPGPAAGAP